MEQQKRRLAPNVKVPTNVRLPTVASLNMTFEIENVNLKMENFLHALIVPFQNIVEQH